eukprot:scaffold25567_cov121-Isochrysis_galbana.AAC.4
MEPMRKKMPENVRRAGRGQACVSRVRTPTSAFPSAPALRPSIPPAVLDGVPGGSHHHCGRIQSRGRRDGWCRRFSRWPRNVRRCRSLTAWC